MPRTKVVLAIAAAGLSADDRRAARKAGAVRRSVDDMVAADFGVWSWLVLLWLFWDSIGVCRRRIRYGE